MIWMCPKPKCKTQLPPEHIHFKVKELLQVLKVFCPGCKEPFKYDDMQKHQHECDKIDPARKLDTDGVQELININLQ